MGHCFPALRTVLCLHFPMLGFIPCSLLSFCELWFVCLKFYLCMCVFVSLCVPVHIYVPGEAGDGYQVSFSMGLHLIFWDKVSCWAWSSLIHLGWLVSKPQGSSSLSLGLQEGCAWLFHECGVSHLRPLGCKVSTLYLTASSQQLYPVPRNNSFSSSWIIVSSKFQRVYFFNHGKEPISVLAIRTLNHFWAYLLSSPGFQVMSLRIRDSKK